MIKKQLYKSQFLLRVNKGQFTRISIRAHWSPRVMNSIDRVVRGLLKVTPSNRVKA